MVRLLFSDSFFVNSIVVGYDCYEISDQLYVFRVCMYVCMCMCVDIYICFYVLFRSYTWSLRRRRYVVFEISDPTNQYTYI